jgi:hypothetical protein
MQKLVLLLVVLCVTFAVCQQSSAPQQSPTSQPGPAPSSTEEKKTSTADGPPQVPLAPIDSNTLISKERIPYGARVYVAPMANGFDNYVIAGIQQKKVPIIIVADRSRAEFEITGIAETDKAGWAKMLFLGSQQTNETASIKMVNLRTGAVIFAYSVNKVNSVRGKQSAGEACAKHIKEKIID